MQNQSRIAIATLGIGMGCLLCAAPSLSAEVDAADSMSAKQLVQLPSSEIRKIVDLAIPHGTPSQQVVKRMKKMGFECEIIQNSSFLSHDDIVDGVIQGVYLPHRDFISCWYADKFHGYDRENGILFLLDGDGEVERCRLACYLRVP